MKPTELQPFALGVLQLLALALVGYGLYTIQSVILFAIIALYLSILGRPIVKFLGKFPKLDRFPTLRATAALLVILGILGSLISVLAPLVIDEFAFLTEINYNELIAGLEDEWKSLDRLLSTFGINTNAELAKFSSNIERYASADAIGAIATSVLGSIGNLAVATFSIIFITFFLLREQHLAHQFIDWVTPAKHHHKIDEMTPKIKRVVTRYSFGILLQIGAIFSLLAIGLSLVGVQGAVVLALIAAVFNLIPYVGPIIGAVLGILLSLGQLYTAQVADASVATDLLPSFYLLIALFGGVQLLDNVLFQPLIFSNSVGAHPLEIFLVISVAGTLLGVGAMIFAVPLYSIIRIVSSTVWSSWQQNQPQA